MDGHEMDRHEMDGQEHAHDNGRDGAPAASRLGRVRARPHRLRGGARRRDARRRRRARRRVARRPFSPVELRPRGALQGARRRRGARLRRRASRPCSASRATPAPSRLTTRACRRTPSAGSGRLGPWHAKPRLGLASLLADALGDPAPRLDRLVRPGAARRGHDLPSGTRARRRRLPDCDRRGRRPCWRRGRAPRRR